MIAAFHFLRPYWLLALIPLMVLSVLLWRHKHNALAWSKVCDPHLLERLLLNKGSSKRLSSLFIQVLSLLFMILGLAGPTWHKYPVATFKTIQPRVLVLDMSEHMLLNDLTPNRLSRAKFKLRDLFSHKSVGQFGLVVYTGEPFVVSPLTEDGETITSLLSTLSPHIMPIPGQNLASALNEAQQLIKKAGYNRGQILVFTSDSPSSEAIENAKKLAAEGTYSSIIPMIASADVNPLFRTFAKSGNGLFLKYSSESKDLQQWLKFSNSGEEFALNNEDDIPLWRDEGRWFLIPALFFLLPAFRRGWLQRIVA
jgi:Ca-activated chloride channel family protein